MTLKNGLIITYIIFIFVSFLYVRHVLSQDVIEVDEKESKKEAIDVKEVDVYLEIENTLNEQKLSYKYDFRNTDTVLDLLEKARQEDPNFMFERTEYRNHTVLHDVTLVGQYEDNASENPQSHVWKIYYNNEDITNQITEFNLDDDGIYYMKLVPDSRFDNGPLL